MKYVILERMTSNGGIQRVPIIFPNDLVHKHVADAIHTVMGPAYLFTGKVYSAGSIDSQSLLVSKDLTSDSLDLGPQPDDQDTIFMNDYMHGYKSLPAQASVATTSPTPENWEKTEQVITGHPEKTK